MIDRAQTRAASHSEPLPFRLLLFVGVALSSLVTVEPAPYDLLSILLLLLYFGSGLKFAQAIVAPVLLLGLVAVANFISAVFSDSTAVDYNLVEFTRYLAITMYLFLSFVLFACLTKRYPQAFLQTMWAAYSVAGFIAAMAGLYGFFDLGPGAEELLKAGRARGFFKDPNVLGPFLVPLILHHGFLLLTSWSWSSVTRVLYLALLLMALLVAFSRGAWGNALLATGVAFALVFLTSARTYERLRIAAVFVVAALVVVIAIVALANTPALKDMIDKRANLVNSYDVNEGGRFDTQALLAGGIFSNPIGHGPNHTPLVPRAPHNVYIKLFAENGWLGGLAWLAFTILTLVSGFRYCLISSPFQQSMIIMYSVVVATAAESIIIDTLHWRHYFLTLGVLWGLIALVRSELPKQTQYAPPLRGVYN